MRIVADYRPALRSRTGVGEYMHGLLRAFAAGSDDEVVLFTSSWKDRPALDLRADVGALVSDHRIPVSVLNALWHRLEWPPIESLAGACDVVHAAHPLLIPARRAAQVVTIHDLYFLTHPEQTRAEIRRDYPRLAAGHARRADAIITSSAPTRRLVHERFHVPLDRIYVCPPGAPGWRTLGQVPAPARAGYLLFLGTLEPRKNLGVLLDAYVDLLGRARRVPPLLIAGQATAAAQPWLDRLSKDGLGAHVTYRGYVASGEREPLFAGACALAMPSFDEGFGLPVLEAMSAGVPVLCSDRGSLPDVVGPAGVTLDPDDVSAWAGAIERIAADPAWAEALGRAGLARARDFTWEQSALTLQQAYRDAVQRRGAR
jgi:glycosyltransferase involved in cell wall biosynthesis